MSDPSYPPNPRTQAFSVDEKASTKALYDVVQICKQPRAYEISGRSCAARCDIQTDKMQQQLYQVVKEELRGTCPEASHEVE